jgi:hypothetical protein
MARTDFGSIQKAIQDAFDTYWRVKENKADRGERVKDREQRMRELQMTLASTEATAAEKIKAEKELESLRQTGATNLETQKAGIATDIYNRPDEAAMRGANIKTTQELGGMYSRSPMPPGAAEAEKAKWDNINTLPLIYKEAEKNANDLFADISMLDYPSFNKKHAGWMNEEEYGKLKNQGLSAQTKWALNKALDMAKDIYRPLFIRTKIENEYDTYMEGFKARWQPNLAEIAGTTKPITSPQAMGPFHTPGVAEKAKESQKVTGESILDWIRRQSEGYQNWAGRQGR